MEYTVKEVSSRKEFRDFYQFQNRLYRDCPVYVPSLDFDQKKSLSKSPCLDYCSQKLLLAYDSSGKLAGRCCAIINPRYNERYGTRRMRFGWTDFIDDYDAFKALMDAAVEWGREQGMTEIHGPLGYNTMYKQGMVVEGFENEPQFNNLYNFSYYPEFVERYGFVKEADWLQYSFSGTQGIPERIRRISGLLMERYGLRIVPVEELCRRKDIIGKFFKSYNEAFASVRNFVPFTGKEIAEEGAGYIDRLRNSLSCIIMDSDDEVASFGICTPSLSKALRRTGGRLFPFGWLHLLLADRHTEKVDMMLVGSASKWRGKGLSSIFHTYLADSFERTGVKVCISNPQFEDNPAVKVWDSYSDKTLYIRRRCYIKTI